MRGRKYSVTDMAAAAAFVLVLGISSFWGMGERENAAGGQTPGLASEAGMDGAAAGTAGNGTGSDGAAEVLILDGSQKASVTQIMAQLKLGKLEEAAKILETREGIFQELFYGALDGGRYLFDGEVFRKDIDGEGMVFTKAGTVYYGTFKDGKPEGACTALQAVDLDAPRYDYSQGMWKDGRMEGEGHTGYCYYGKIPPGEARDICKTGTFSGDRMEGGVVYTSMNGKEDESIWKLTVTGGVTVTDDRWDYNESTGEYLLLSENDDNHAYVLGEDQIMQPMWQNLLVWDE